MKRKVESITMAVIGALLFSLGILFTYTILGGYEENYLFSNHNPDYDCYIYGEIQFWQSQNYSLGVLSPGELVHADAVGYALDYYRNPIEWIEVRLSPNATGKINFRLWLYRNGEIVASSGKGGEWEEHHVGERLILSYPLDYEVKTSGLSYIVNVVCVSELPYSITFSLKVTTIYGRTGPYLIVAGLVLMCLATIMFGLSWLRRKR
jgi:hypothetical protein